MGLTSGELVRKRVKKSLYIEHIRYVLFMKSMKRVRKNMLKASGIVMTITLGHTGGGVNLGCW